MHSDHPDMLEQDLALTEIDTICRGGKDERPEQAGDRLFEEEIEKMFERTEEQSPSWMEFIDDLRNGRYGELPEDYDGLARPEGAE